MQNDNATAVRRFFDEVCNQRNLDAVDELFTRGHTYHDPSNPWVGLGPDGMRQLMATYHNAFVDAHWTIDEMIVAGDTVVTRWIAHGTHTGTLQDVAPTRRTVEVRGIWIHRFADGKIVESWNVWDTLGMMHQLGVLNTTSERSTA